MDYQQIAVEDRDEIRLITLDRPEKLNAWTPSMHDELVNAFTEGNEAAAIGAFVASMSNVPEYFYSYALKYPIGGLFVNGERLWIVFYRATIVSKCHVWLGTP